MENKRQFIYLKEWFLDKIENVSKTYNVFIDTPERQENGIKVVTADGFVKVLVDEVLAETEKAVQVRLSSGAVVGSCKGWKTWIPKSVFICIE